MSPFTVLYGLAVRAVLELVVVAVELERRVEQARRTVGRLVRG